MTIQQVLDDEHQSKSALFDYLAEEVLKAWNLAFENSWKNFNFIEARKCYLRFLTDH